jgi:hypothetical protein
MTIEGNGNVGIGLTNPSFKLHVYAADDDTAIVAATGGVQGTGVFYVGQSTAYGGGIAYNGDGTPDWDGSGSDYISLFRRDNNVNYWTARNFYNSNNWEFRGYISHQNPIFYAYISGSGPASSNYVTYDQTYVNVGSNYNIANGVFTCPVAGIYTFTWGAIGNNSSTIYRYYIRKNNVNVGDTHLRLDTKSTSSNDYGIGQRSVTFSLSFNDTIRIYYISENGTSDYGNQYTYFQGQLISTN